MLVALDAQEQLVVAFNTKDKNADYFCPECGERVILKRGNIKIPHFAHAVNSHCSYGQGETQEHLEVKRYLYEYFRQRGIEVHLEFREWDDIRPDVAAKINDNWVGFEVQKSVIDISKIQERMRRNEEHGVYVIWILPQNMYDVIKDGKNFYLSDWQKYLMKLYYGNLYVYGDGNIHAIKCNKPLKRYSPFYATHDMVVDLLNDFKCRYKPEYYNLPSCHIYNLSWDGSQEQKRHEVEHTVSNTDNLYLDDGPLRFSTRVWEETNRKWDEMETPDNTVIEAIKVPALDYLASNGLLENIDGSRMCYVDFERKRSC